MIIECTACQKKFSVPDQAITASGRLVQCSSCGNRWTQYPSKKERKIVSPLEKKQVKKIIKKKQGPAPYSQEYMKQKWGSSIQSYVKDKKLNKKTTKKSVKQKKERFEQPSYGFFNYIITIAVFSTFLVGILGFEKTRLSRKFPILEPYINYFFETLENFKIFILDLY